MAKNSINNKFIDSYLTSIQNTFQKIKKTRVYRVFFTNLLNTLLKEYVDF